MAACTHVVHMRHAQAFDPCWVLLRLQLGATVTHEQHGAAHNAWLTSGQQPSWVLLAGCPAQEVGASTSCHLLLLPNQSCLHPHLPLPPLQSAQDAAIERQEYAFTFRGSKLGKLKSLALAAVPLGDTFLGGGEALKYVAAGTAYTITAGRRGRGDIKHYVPRCIGGSPEADLDATNTKLMVRRYGRNHTHNK